MLKSYLKILIIVLLILNIFEVTAKTKVEAEKENSNKIIKESSNQTIEEISNQTIKENSHQTNNTNTNIEPIKKIEEKKKGESDLEGSGYNPNVPVLANADGEILQKEVSNSKVKTTVKVRTNVYEKDKTTKVEARTTSASRVTSEPDKQETRTKSVEVDESKSSQIVAQPTFLPSETRNFESKPTNVEYNVGGEKDSMSDMSSDDNSSVLFKTITYGSVLVGVVGLIAVSGYRVVKRKAEGKNLKSKEFYSSTFNYTIDSMNPSSLSEMSSKNRSSLVSSLIYENDNSNEEYMYYMGKNIPYATGVIQDKDINEIENEQQTNIILNMYDSYLPYQAPIQNEEKRKSRRSVISVSRSSITSITSISKNSVVRHSFLNPNINIVRTSKRTQQLFEATEEHPAIIETFPSLERPFVPAVPVTLEESDVNSLHPHSIYQMYQDEMEFENYYAYTIDNKEYIIDPTTNRVLEIHNLDTDDYMLVEEELYLDFSGSSSEDSDSEKQT
ncbi:hypothetical protein H8356DRAFT_1273606 [Neocallimastix lanati (nom. inval.)]|jgi:hypothetical protein|uniref:Uncharacterized protein n=1 Tax=Neocallimastix californiae TaxID=1754190 RepID=A0A1Y2DWR5_9FUNG|nr:hypothetical protein H8356DRAFT_1273606 [Neocallimastix sp. JGI-2020a]ORY63730.1 hypothetical protein LY90DRAFT_231377 [Neocallimastix californiae]|eukprot:ORY63730.1 hypothetical protein LY90DRAFT_231377 [Neocallimastix californiae]